MHAALQGNQQFIDILKKELSRKVEEMGMKCKRLDKLE